MVVDRGGGSEGEERETLATRARGERGLLVGCGSDCRIRVDVELSMARAERAKRYRAQARWSESIVSTTAWLSFFLLVRLFLALVTVTHAPRRPRRLPFPPHQHGCLACPLETQRRETEGMGMAGVERVEPALTGSVGQFGSASIAHAHLHARTAAAQRKGDKTTLAFAGQSSAYVSHVLFPALDLLPVA